MKTDARRRVRIFLLLLGFISVSPITYAQGRQSPNTNNTAEYLTLKQCIDYAMQHQPILKASTINIAITKTTNGINVSGWLPQVGLTGSYVHYIEQPTTLITTTPGGPPVPEKTSVINTLIPTLSVTQAIFSPSLLYSAISARTYTKQAIQSLDSNKINVVAAVSKSFYNLLLTLEQINVLQEDTARLNRNMTDAYHQYVGGIVDETDYDEAAISLNNSRAQLRQSVENVRPLYAALKQAMGYPPQQQFNVSFDTAQMAQDINLDTTEQLQYEKRIEYKQLQTAKELQRKFITYNGLTFLPSLNAYYNYNYEFENNVASDLFNTAYPNSLIGVGLTFPIFTGLSRVENIHKAKLQGQLLNWREESLKSEIYTEYTNALASYRGNLYNLQMLQANVAMAQKVYFIVELQYKQGIVPYLNVITAESNLISSETGYINALFTVLSSKIDLEQAMGNIAY